MSDDVAVQRRRKVPLRTKVLFASGALQEATVTIAAMITVLYYNQVLGLSAGLAGTAFFILPSMPHYCSVTWCFQSPTL